MNWLEFLSRIGRRKLGVGNDWEAADAHREDTPGIVAVMGTRNQNEILGFDNLTRVMITTEEQDAEMVKVEAELDICGRCLGRKGFVAYARDLVPCSRCNGTGKPPVTEA